MSDETTCPKCSKLVAAGELYPVDWTRENTEYWCLDYVKEIQRERAELVSRRITGAGAGCTSTVGPGSLRPTG